jgi:hypothetical protein
MFASMGLDLFRTYEDKQSDLMRQAVSFGPIYMFRSDLNNFNAVCKAKNAVAFTTFGWGNLPADLRMGVWT